MLLLACSLIETRLDASAGADMAVDLVVHSGQSVGVGNQRLEQEEEEGEENTQTVAGSSHGITPNSQPKDISIMDKGAGKDVFTYAHLQYFENGLIGRGDNPHDSDDDQMGDGTIPPLRRSSRHRGAAKSKSPTRKYPKRKHKRSMHSSFNAIPSIARDKPEPRNYFEEIMLKGSSLFVELTDLTLDMVSHLCLGHAVSHSP